jgi:hypothetical protein
MITHGRVGRTSLFVCFVSALLYLGLFTGSVRAEEAAKPMAEYKVAFDKVSAEYEAKRWSGAIVLCQKARLFNPNARTSPGMGLAAFERQPYDPAEITIAVDGHPAAIEDGKFMLDPVQQAAAAAEP